jgi:hypothetical protein
MIAATVLAVFFVPLFFVLVHGSSEWVAKLLHGHSRMVWGRRSNMPWL